MKRQNDMEMIQSAVRLPRSLHERLKKAGGRRGMGEEIRRRLQFSIDAEKISSDPTTRELLGQIEDIARDLSSDEPWFANQFAFDVFKAAVDALLLSRRPSGEAEQGTRAKLQATYGDEKPETIGRIIARHAIIAYAREDERYNNAVLEVLERLKKGSSREVVSKAIKEALDTVDRQKE